MALSNDLISQFVKITNDNSDSKKETIVYGTATEYDGSMYVKIDGSELLTPISTTADVKNGERVTVMIKNHNAIITGNISSPAARTGTVGEVNYSLTALTARINKLESDTITADNLSAINASIKNLEADNVKINNGLTANTADIERLDANMITTDKLEAVEADIDELSATHATFETATANRFNAAEAKIADLDAIKADIDVLDADVADINTLIFGSATGNTIQTSFANAIIAQLGDAQIKSAMIKDISAGKITAGDIITNNVRIKSEDGSLIISDETMQISDDTRVRVQIGKDASNDYSINIWDADGELMFSQGGITDHAIKEAIIRNDMVSDTANISAHKLDIDSLFEEINKDGSNTIKSTKVYLDDEKQTLDLAFKGLTTTVNDLGETVSSQGTQISAVQGQISSKVWQQDINTAKNEMSTKYSTLEQEVDGFKTTVGNTYATKTDLSNLKIGGRNLFGFNKGVQLSSLGNTAYSSITFNRDIQGFEITTKLDAPANMIIGRVQRLGFNGQAGESYTFSATVYSNVDEAVVSLDICDIGDIGYVIGTTPQKISFSAIPTNYYDDTNTYNGFFDVAVGSKQTIPAGTTLYFKNVKIERGNKVTDWTPAPEDMATATEMQDVASRVESAETIIEQNTDSIVTLVNRTTTVENKFGNYSTTEQMNSAIKQKADSITSEVSSVYATKDLVNNLEIGGRNLALGTSSPLTVAASEEFVSRTSSKVYTLAPVIRDDPKAFLLSIRNSYLALSYDIDIGAIYKDPSMTLNRVGGYITFNFKDDETGETVSWYGTHTKPISAGNNTFGYDNSLISVPETARSYIAHYAGYCDMAAQTGIISRFYADPDRYTVTTGSAIVEIRGFTTGGTIKNIKLEIGNKPTAWSPAPEDIDSEIQKVGANGTNLVQTSYLKIDNGSKINFNGESTQEFSAKAWVGRLMSVTRLREKFKPGETYHVHCEMEIIEVPADAQNGVYSTGMLLNWFSSSAGQYLTLNGTLSGTVGAVGFKCVIDKTIVCPEIYDDSQLTLYTVLYKNASGGTGDCATVKITNFKIERGDKYTGWTPAPEDIGELITANRTYINQTAYDLSVSIVDSAKTATNYLNFSNDGLTVGDMTASTLGKNVLIDSDSVDIRNGTTTLASFGANTVTLGRNAEDSVIDLCDGAGRISANTAEAATSFPNRNAILIESQEIETESVRFVASTSNKYGATSTPSIVRGTELYMQRSSSSSESCARLKAEHKTTSSGAYTNSGVSAMTYDSASTTRAMVYASDSANSAHNQVNVYPTKTTMNKNLVLNGTTFTGKNKVLWTGGYYMSDSQTATLSEAISAQANGVVLVWSEYTDGESSNANFNMTYIPKHFITLQAGKGVNTILSNGSMNIMATKYVYVSDTSIKGYAGNDDAATAKDSGVTSTSNRFVLRYVIGV